MDAPSGAIGTADIAIAGVRALLVGVELCGQLSDAAAVWQGEAPGQQVGGYVGRNGGHYSV